MHAWYVAFPKIGQAFLGTLGGQKPKASYPKLSKWEVFLFCSISLASFGVMILSSSTLTRPPTSSRAFLDVSSPLCLYPCPSLLPKILDQSEKSSYCNSLSSIPRGALTFSRRRHSSLLECRPPTIPRSSLARPLFIKPPSGPRPLPNGHVGKGRCNHCFFGPCCVGIHDDFGKETTTSEYPGLF